MSAKVIFKKYTGKESDFATPISAAGLKRVDWCVPSVYSDASSNIIPANDASDVSTYSIYRPDTPDCKAYSFETILKLHLLEAPDTQLSNIRLYPIGNNPNNENYAKLYIGNSITYSKPTNTKSLVAINNIWNYSEENPFYLTVSGNYGQNADPRLDISTYSVSYKDYGYGNVIYLNGERQQIIPVANKQDSSTNIEITFINNTYDTSSSNFIEFTDMSGNIINGYTNTISSSEGYITTLYVKDDTRDMFTAYPDGIMYRIPTKLNTGYLITWVVFPTSNYDTKITETHEIYVQTGPDGKLYYYIDNVKNPCLNIDINRNYIFSNKSGNQFPLRFIHSHNNPMANNPNDIVISGINVIDGSTEDETIYINTDELLKSGECIGSYQCVIAPELGNHVYNYPMFMTGNYNLCRLDGGIYNPLLAGETDYIYLQLEVDGNTLPGSNIPDIEIKYDEN